MDFLDTKAIDKALGVLDIVTPKPSESRFSCPHARLIQSCIDDLVRTNGGGVRRANEKPNGALVGILKEEFQFQEKMDDCNFFVLQELHRQGFLPNPVSLSSVLSWCASVRDLRTGSQLHSMTVKIFSNSFCSIPVVTSLLTLYSKCDYLGDACRLFDEMPTRNTIVYTSMISAMAQRHRVDSCVELFVDMKRCGFEPNDYTFASILTGCTDAGWLGIGKSLHSVELQMGYDPYIYVSNALISMYAKCGCVGDATQVFDNMSGRKDLISWNSIISAFAQYGLADEASNKLDEMRDGGGDTSPDAITYLGVLSSYRHVGMVERGLRCFNTMVERGIAPNMEHYACMVDLLGRAGLLELALGLIFKMPLRPNAVIWGSLLSSCKVHGNVEIGILAARSRLVLEPECAATYVQLANLYAATARWGEFAAVRKLMKDRGLRTSSGCSWIEIGHEIHMFKAEAKSKTAVGVNRALKVLDCLDCHMKSSPDRIDLKD